MSVPTIVTVHDVAWLRVQEHTRVYARYYFGKFAIERYKRAAYIAVDSGFSRNELLEVVPAISPDKVRVVYPGVAEDFMTLERKGSDGHTILVVGTVERRKNLMAIIEALPQLPNARIVSVGPPTPYQEDCIVRAHALGVYDRVEFRGYVDRAEVLDLYATCAVVAMPSRYEGFGYAAAQGLCVGAPVVVSDQASLPEVVNGDGVVVPVDDTGGWVDALRAALGGDRNTSAMASRESARERFAWHHSAEQMKQLYILSS
jgi:glycosyltransferase involved in cell wall biosynthesis